MAGIDFFPEIFLNSTESVIQTMHTTSYSKLWQDHDLNRYIFHEIIWNSTASVKPEY